jgi:hypothetical protein
MKIRFLIRDTVDRRTVEQLHRYDSLEAKRFAIRVAKNTKERARLARLPDESLPAMLRRQAG